MRARLAVATGMMLSFAIPSVAIAQDPVDAFQAQANMTYEKFVSTAKTLIASADILREARGIKSDAEKTKQLLADLEKGKSKPDPKLLESMFSRIEGDSQGLDSLKAETAALTAEQKALFSKGVLEYARGVKETAVLALEVPALASAAVTTAAGLATNPLKFRKVKDALSAAKDMGAGIPRVAKGHANVMGSLKSYIAKQGLSLDLSGLGK